MVTDVRTTDTVALLLAVARLGESDLADWWPSQCMSPAGRYLMPRTFPRTWRAAAGQLLLLTARRWHDRAFDRRPTALHLYSDRLPGLGWATSWLAEQKTTAPPDQLFDRLQSWDDPEQARSAIRDLTKTATPRTQPIAGRLFLGNLTQNDLTDPDRVDEAYLNLAAAYLESGSTLAAPYYDQAS